MARYADVIHSVDRLRLVTALGAAARRADRPLRCLVQVSLDDEPGRGGAAAARCWASRTRWPARPAWSWAA